MGNVEIKHETEMPAGDALVAAEIEQTRYELRFRLHNMEELFEQRVAEVKLDIVLGTLATVLCAYLVIRAVSWQW